MLELYALKGACTVLRGREGTNESARKALLASRDAFLEHGIGKRSPKETVLTRSEFCSRLTRLRKRLTKESVQA